MQLLIKSIIIGDAKLFLAPPTTKLGLHWWSQSHKSWLLNYNAQLSFIMHSNSKLKKNIK